MTRLIDAERLYVICGSYKGYDAKSYMAGIETVMDKIDATPTVCCENCKHARCSYYNDGTPVKSEYISCGKPYAPPNPVHRKDWVCGDWEDKDATD